MDASGAASILYARRYNNSDTTYDAGIIKTGFNQSNFSPQPPELTWFYLALSCSGTGASDSKLRWWSVSGVLQNSVTVAGQSYTPATLYFGDPHGAIAYAKYAYCRVWDAVLTDAELLNEMRSAAIVKTASINTALRTNSLTDVSGNGRDWTDVNADVVIDTEDNPPMWVFKKVAAARRHVPHLIR